MRKSSIRQLVGFALSLLLCAAAAAQDASPFGVSLVETDDVKLLFSDRLRDLYPHALRTFKNSFDFQRRLLGWSPTERVTVMLKDSSDYGNASATALPHDALYIDVAPLSHAFETWPASERMYSLMNHELVHVSQNDLANSEDRAWRRFFLGKPSAQSEYPESLLYTFLAAPRYNAPRWYHEGGATFLETWKSGGLGRGQGGYDEMLFRAMVRDGDTFFDPVSLESRGMRTDFQAGATAYLYGTRFFTWLAYQYSPEKVVAWMRRDEGSKRWYASQFEAVFGMPLADAWSRWVDFEHKFQQDNLARVREHPVTPYRTLVDRALGSISRTYYDETTGTLYGAFRMPGVIEHVGALDVKTGSIRRLADIRSAMHYRVASFAFDAQTGTAFYTDDNWRRRDLFAVDVRTGETRLLLEDARIGEIAFNRVDRSLLGVRHSGGFAELVRIPYPYDDWKVLHRFPYEVVPYDLDVSPDGRYLSASSSEANGDQYVRVWELKRVLAGDMKPLSQFRFGDSVPESFVFSADGKYLYGSSYYSGVSNIFRYEVATGDLEAVSNAEIGFFRPQPLSDGRLLVLAYSAAGFVPAIIQPTIVKDVSAIRFLGTELVKRYPSIKDWQVPPPSTVDEQKLITRRGPYDPDTEVQLDNGFPVLQGYRDAVGVGYHLNFSDPLYFTSAGATFAITPGQGLPSSERVHIMLDATYRDWRGSLAWNPSDFYDLFGPTKRSRKGLAAKVGYDDSLIYSPPRTLDLSLDAAWYDHIDTLPDAQNVPSGASELGRARAQLVYSDVRRSVGAVDDEKGLKWTALVGADEVPGETAWYARGTLDVGWDLPQPNASLWWRNAAGYVNGDPSVPIANFYLGAFGNNYVDRYELKRYREWYSFPGFGIDEIKAQSFIRSMAEWNASPYAFDDAGVPGLHINWMRPALFASALWTDVGAPSRRRDYANAGTQFDFYLAVAHRYTMTLSVGYAVGFTDGRRSGDEWMVSLKIL